MNRDTLAEWRSHILARRVVVSGGGPPCETWSASRWAEGKGPPPLRTHDQFGGKTAVTERQMEQLWVGNALYHAMLELFAAHMQAGTSCWLEHPQPCGWRLQAVS
eukprot:4734837-Pyramimonas_sp.AAC.1